MGKVDRPSHYPSSDVLLQLGEADTEVDVKDLIIQHQGRTDLIPSFSASGRRRLSVPRCTISILKRLLSSAPSTDCSAPTHIGQPA